VYIPEDEVLKKIQGHSIVNVFFAWLSSVIIFSFASDRMTVPFFY
jgi:hypothetical protein